MWESLGSSDLAAALAPTAALALEAVLFFRTTSNRQQKQQQPWLSIPLPSATSRVRYGHHDGGSDINGGGRYGGGACGSRSHGSYGSGSGSGSNNSIAQNNPRIGEQKNQSIAANSDNTNAKDEIRTSAGMSRCRPTNCKRNYGTIMVTTESSPASRS